ncbi:protein FAM3A isoform X2 [Sphaerodactylus townsendi]|uniref:protein FAM3A isoform X2 n=1 Tax=Sphaerodactylus townsendi TaxID=933632 RepID=UPI0020272AA8|nr:protein FAM3A isoform X2 [Sphaerodactylus townsendi]
MAEGPRVASAATGAGGRREESPPTQRRKDSSSRGMSLKGTCDQPVAESFSCPGTLGGQERWVLCGSRHWQGTMRLAGPLRVVVIILTAGLTWILVSILLGTQSGFSRLQQLLNNPESPPSAEPRPKKFKCGLSQACPDQTFAFRITSGAANVIGPKICLEDKMLMSSLKDNVGRGLNIALVNDVTELLKFIRPLHEGTLVFVASYDDPATKMNDETRKIFTELGSSVAKDLAFRDSWVFVGAKGVQDKSPFEQHVKNSKSSNKYEGWPEALEMEGCIPQRTADVH